MHKDYGLLKVGDVKRLKERHERHAAESEPCERPDEPMAFGTVVLV